MAKLLLGSYRSGDANDPEVYVSAMLRVLSAYPLEIVMRVVDPLTGIVSKIGWLPSPKEVMHELEEIYGPIRRNKEWDKRTEEQLAEREQRERELAEAPRVDLKTKFGEAYGLDPVEKLSDEEKERKKRLVRMEQTSDHAIARDYATAGELPVVTGGILISKTLVRSIKQGT